MFFLGKHLVARFGDRGRKDEEVRGDEPKKECLITQNKTLNKRKHGSSSSGLSLSSSGLSRSVCVRICSLALDSRLAAGGPLLNSLRQSLETDTGVNHHSLAHCFPARLGTRSPLSAFRLPTPPLATYPHRPSQAGEPSGLQPPPPPFLERKSATAICTPGLWTTLNLKGCNARYQRVIRALVSFMRWSHWRGAWSEQRVNSRPRR